MNCMCIMIVETDPVLSWIDSKAVLIVARRNLPTAGYQ